MKAIAFWMFWEKFEVFITVSFKLFLLFYF